MNDEKLPHSHTVRTGQGLSPVQGVSHGHSMTANAGAQFASWRSLLFLIVVASMTNAVLANNTDAPAPSGDQGAGSGELSEVVVTANKVGGDLQRVPISAVTIDSKAMVELNVHSLDDMQVVAPSLVYNNFTGVAQAYIRGIGTNQSYAGLESSVATYLDGVYLQRQTGADLASLDLANVQILNGPQGSLYGRNATGGVILVNTADPTQKFEGHVQVKAGNLGTIGYEGVLNAPITPTLAFRVAAQYTKSDGYVTNVPDGEKLLGGDSGTVRGKLKWTPSDSLTATLSADFHNESETTQGGHQVGPASLCTACVLFGSSPPPAGLFYTSATTPGQVPLRVPSGGAGLTVVYDGGSFTINSVTGYRAQSWQFWADQDFATPDLEYNTAKEVGHTFTEDLYVRSHFDGPFNGLVGISGERDQDHFSSSLYGAAFGPIQGLTNNSRVSLSSGSIYAEGEYEFGSGYKVTLGGRDNVDKKVLDAGNNAAAQAALGSPAVFDAHKTFNDFTPRGVLSHQSGDTNVYASISRGAKSGGYSAPAYGPLNPLRSETLTSYEIGLKTSLFDHVLQIETAVFHYDYKNMQVTFVDAATGGFVSENAAAARSNGLELNAHWRVLPGLKLDFGGLGLNSKFTSYTRAGVFFPSSAGFTSGVEDLTGSVLPRSPKFSAYASANYLFNLSSRLTSTVAIADRYTSSYYFDAGAGGPAQIDQQGSFNMGRLSIAIADPSVGTEVRFYMDNALGVKYREAAATSSLAAYYLAAPPRTYGAMLTYSF
jgi:iron complex outermembrane recepter protein